MGLCPAQMLSLLGPASRLPPTLLIDLGFDGDTAVEDRKMERKQEKDDNVTKKGKREND